MSSKNSLRTAICASGRGTNAEALIRFEKEQAECSYEVALIISTKASAGVVEVAAKFGIPVEVQKATPADEKANAVELSGILKSHRIELICLAGYMRKVPLQVIREFEGRIVNIHPALLPKFGGAGMYGSRVFEAILASDESESGVSIHVVTEDYDNGAVLAQERFLVESGENVQSLAEKTQKVEHRLYPEVLERIAQTGLVENWRQKNDIKEENL